MSVSDDAKAYKSGGMDQALSKSYSLAREINQTARADYPASGLTAIAIGESPGDIRILTPLSNLFSANHVLRKLLSDIGFVEMAPTEKIQGDEFGHDGKPVKFMIEITRHERYGAMIAVYVFNSIHGKIVIDADPKPEPQTSSGRVSTGTQKIDLIENLFKSC
jgi:hypothetical protein